MHLRRILIHDGENGSIMKLNRFKLLDKSGITVYLIIFLDLKLPCYVGILLIST